MKKRNKRKLGLALIWMTLGLLLASIFAVTGAQAADLCVDPGDPACYDTIQAAIDAATAGDTINVASGTYNEKLTVNKPITLQGAGSSTTIVDGASLGEAILVSISNPADDITIDGFTFKNATDYQIVVSGGTNENAEIAITNNIIIGNGEGHDYGLYGSGFGESKIFFNNNDVSNCNYHGFFLERWLGETEVSYNTFTEVADNTGNRSIGFMTYEKNTEAAGIADVTTKQYVHDNTIDANGSWGGIIFIAPYGYGYNDTYSGGRYQGGKFTNVEIKNNTILNQGAAGAAIQLEVDGDYGGIFDAVIDGNSVTAKTLHEGRGIRILAGAEGAVIQNNEFTELKVGVYQSYSWGEPGAVGPTGNKVNYNSFNDCVYGVDNQYTDILNVVDATRNWWGDASGPEDTAGSKEVLEDYTCSEVTVAEMKNANGLGAGVSDNVDYCPWTTQETQDDGDVGEDGGKVSRKCMADNSGGVCRKSVVKVTVFENTVPDGSQIRIQEKSGANFQLGDRVFDITILEPNGEELNNFDPPVEICLRPTNAQLKKAGWNFANLVMFHRHAGGPWEPVYNTYEKDGKLCAKMWLLSEFAIGISQLPDTGFAPGFNHALPLQPVEKAYSTYDGFMLDIPSLGLNMPIVGVPLAEDGWDVQWLGRRAGWLHGTAFPTWAGNTAITAHVWDADNNPGPFIDLGNLQHGDEVIIHAWGLRHTYEVRGTEQVRPDDLRALPHTEYDTLTLLTCQGYDESSSEYDWRLAVRAVLIDVEAE